MEAVLADIKKGKATSLTTGKKDASFSDLSAGEGQTSASLNLASSEQTLQVDSSYGVIMHRDVIHSEEGSIIRAEVDHGCNTTDAFGSNDCLIPANDKIRIKMYYKLNEPVTEGYTVQMNVSTRLFGYGALIGQHILGWKSDKFVQDINPINSTCPLCGGQCTVEFMGQKLTSTMPPCPLPANVETVMVDQEFRVPPVNGIEMIRSKFVGSVALRRADGSVFAHANATLRIGERDMAPCPFILSYINKCKN
eukprot:UN2369